MRRRVLVELAQLEERYEHAALAVHRQRERSDDRLRLGEWEGAALADLTVHPLHRLCLFLQGEGDRRDGHLRFDDVVELLRLAPHTDRAEFDRPWTRRPHFGAVDRRDR